MDIRDAARERYAVSGLSYNNFFDNKDLLVNEIQKELDRHACNGGLKMALYKKIDSRFEKGTRNIECFFIYVNGPYFKKREAISFNPEGFIGFSGWASDSNAAPIVNGFLSALSLIQSETASECSPH